MKYQDKMETLKEWEDTAENQEFKYPMWFKSVSSAFIVEFNGLESGRVIIDNKYSKAGEYSTYWIAHTNTKYWQQVENSNKDLDDIVDEAINEVTRGDGGSTNYYELPKGATELRHLIRHKKMSHSIGEVFCAIYRLNDNGEYLRNLKKAKFYIDSEIEEYEKENK